ncbi:hypothetical protein DIPPA_52918 [Diplonema papillatum]|nr:hypothetical protein DIPPA_52918 [Diplonema papillatum]
MALQNNMSVEDSHRVGEITSFFSNRLLLKKYRSEGRDGMLPEDVAVCEAEFLGLAKRAVCEMNAGPLDAVVWANLCASFSQRWIEVCHWVSPKKFREFLSGTLSARWLNEEDIETDLELPPVDLKWYKNPAGCVPVQPCICPVCRVFCNSMSQYKAHAQGRIHRSLARMFSKKNGGKHVEPVPYESEEQLIEWGVDQNREKKSVWIAGKKSGSKSRVQADVGKAQFQLPVEQFLPKPAERRSSRPATTTRTNMPYAAGVASGLDEPFWVSEREQEGINLAQALQQQLPHFESQQRHQQHIRVPVSNSQSFCGSAQALFYTSTNPAFMQTMYTSAAPLVCKPDAEANYVYSPHGELPPSPASLMHFSASGGCITPVPGKGSSDDVESRAKAEPEVGNVPCGEMSVSVSSNGCRPACRAPLEGSSIDVASQISTPPSVASTPSPDLPAKDDASCDSESNGGSFTPHSERSVDASSTAQFERLWFVCSELSVPEADEASVSLLIETAVTLSKAIMVKGESEMIQVRTLLVDLAIQCSHTQKALVEVVGSLSVFNNTFHDLLNEYVNELVVQGIDADQSPQVDDDGFADEVAHSKYQQLLRFILLLIHSRTSCDDLFTSAIRVLCYSEPSAQDLMSLAQSLTEIPLPRHTPVAAEASRTLAKCLTATWYPPRVHAVLKPFMTL